MVCSRIFNIMITQYLFQKISCSKLSMTNKMYGKIHYESLIVQKNSTFMNMMQSGQLYLRRCLHCTDAFDDSFTFFELGNIFFFLSELVTHVAKRMRNSKTI